VTVRSLDAIYLGTALDIRRSLTSFVTYDKRLLGAAAGASRLPHLTPPPAKMTGALRAVSFLGVLEPSQPAESGPRPRTACGTRPDFTPLFLPDPP
jgi:hypothetical protein